MFRQLLLILTASFILVSCGSLNKAAVRTTSEILYTASFDIESESNWENFEKSVLPNLKMAEGMLSLQPENPDLLATLTKGYAGYALAVNETLWMDDLYSNKMESAHQDQAIANYSKAFEFGLRYINLKKIEYRDLSLKMNDEGAIANLLEKNFDSESLRDKEAILYSAMSLSSLINLQKNKSSLVAQLPIAKQMMDWVCNKDPKIASGACGIFYGAYESSRPKLLGGNPQKGQEHFLKVLKEFPENHLARVLYIQHYIVPSLEENLFKEQMSFLQEQENKFNESWPWTKKKKELTPAEKRLRLYQAIAFKRFNILKKYVKELF